MQRSGLAVSRYFKTIRGWRTVQLRDEIVVVILGILHGATLDDYPTSGSEGMPRQESYSGSLSDQNFAMGPSKRVVHTVDAVKEGCCAVRSGVDFELGS